MNYYPGTALVLWVVGTGGQLFRLFANFIQMDWLGDIGVETRSDRQFAISQHRAGSNRYGGEAAETLVASQLANHTETVENRHLQIQEHNIGRISMDEVKGFTSVCHSATRCPEASKTSRISSRLARLSSATRIVISVHSGPAHFPEPYPSIA